jgi:deoxyribonuclease-1-like protein
MIKQFLAVAAIVAVLGGVYFFLNYEVQTRRDGASVSWKIAPRGPALAVEAPADQPRPTIRIASYQLGRLDDAKLADPRVGEVLVHLLPRFDLVALQGVRGKNQSVLIHLVDQLNAATGRTFDFATCPTQQRDSLEHYTAFVFDRARIDVDRSTVHFVDDPLGRIRIKPLVGMFRAHGPDPVEAFTFMLISVETDADHAAAEVDVLAEAYRKVRDSRPDEDDVILLGDLESDDQHLGQLGKLLGVSALISGLPTTVRGANLLDNILLDRRATSEFTGRVEVVDMIREFDLTISEAQNISEHLPIWAEFSVHEGGRPGHAGN